MIEDRETELQLHFQTWRSHSTFLSARYPHLHAMAILTSTDSSSSFNLTTNGVMLQPRPDKYRGAVVEVCTPPVAVAHVSRRTPQDLQLPPAFALPKTELIARAIELAYDRDFSHIPCAPFPPSSTRPC
jgi:hypothetical protein